jgi:hypothetical protein
MASIRETRSKKQLTAGIAEDKLSDIRHYSKNFGLKFGCFLRMIAGL